MPNPDSHSPRHRSIIFWGESRGELWPGRITSRGRTRYEIPFDGRDGLVYLEGVMKISMNPKNRAINRPALRALICLGLLLLAGSACKNSTTPDGNDKARIRVNNNCGIAIDIYMDSEYKFFLEYREYYYIEDPGLGTHLMEAKKKGTDAVLKSTVAEITSQQDYTWTINSSATVAVVNKYGETLSFYGDGTYQSDIDDGVTATIPNIPYGEHLLEVKRPNESEVLKSTTIDVLGDNLYTWTITK
jgi:hypothetical protein